MIDTLPRAVLFDLDGTLLDSLEDLADSLNAVLSARGMPTHESSAYKHFIGDGIEMLVHRALPAHERSPELIAESVNEMRSEYDSRWDAKTRPFPGVAELLDELVDRDLKLSILSNKPHDFTMRIVKRLLGRWPFEAVVGAQAGVPKKPDPTLALQIVERQGIPPTQWLYLGDSGVDMATAVAAGMTPVGVLWGFRDAEELRNHGAQRLIAHPEELLALLAAKVS